MYLLSVALREYSFMLTCVHVMYVCDVCLSIYVMYASVIVRLRIDISEC